jgi:hypothetical protein
MFREGGVLGRIIVGPALVGTGAVVVGSGWRLVDDRGKESD